MPKTKQTRSEKITVTATAPEPTVCDKADALYRFAFECCRQHRRYARLVEIEADEGEQQSALRLVALSDELLAEAAREYEQSCGRNGGEKGEWWHRANALWLAWREYARRHTMSDRHSGEFRAHDANKFARLALEYDLEASALLALQQAVEAYRKARPDADLNGAAKS